MDAHDDGWIAPPATFLNEGNPVKMASLLPFVLFLLILGFHGTTSQDEEPEPGDPPGFSKWYESTSHYRTSYWNEVDNYPKEGVVLFGGIRSGKNTLALLLTLDLLTLDDSVSVNASTEFEYVIVNNQGSPCLPHSSCD